MKIENNLTKLYAQMIQDNYISKECNVCKI